jgi:hypothetical protein
MPRPLGFHVSPALVVEGSAILDLHAGDCTAECQAVTATCVVRDGLPDDGAMVTVGSDQPIPLADAICGA